MSGWWARWRVAARIARREARRARPRTALVALLVALPVLAGSTWLVALASSVATDATFSRLMLGTAAEARVRHECPVAVAQDLRGGTGGSCMYDETTVTNESPAGLEQDVRGVLGPEATLRELVTAGARAVGAGQGLELDYGELTLDELTRPVLPLTAGRLPSAPGEVVAMPWVLQGLNASIGDTVTITVSNGAPASTLVVGELSKHAQVAAVVGLPGTAPALAAVATPSPADARLEWFVGGPVPVTWEQVLDLNELGFVAASRAVLADPPPRSAMPYYQDGWSAADTPAVSSLTVYAGLIGVGLTEMVLLVGPAFAVGAQRSRRALALQAAVGADRAQLRRTVLGGALVIGLGASLVGAAAGTVLGAVLIKAMGELVNLVVPWAQLAGVVLIGLLVSLAAAALPARAAGRLDVLAVLNGHSRATAHGHRSTRAGLLVGLLGTIAVLVGAVRSLPTVTLAGVVGVLLGTVASAPGLLALAARVHVRLPLAGRYALRDALRHRSRTGPALAAVIAAVAGGVTGATLLAGDLAHTRNTYVPTATQGVLRIVLDRTWLTGDDRIHVPARALAAAADAAPLGDLAPIQILTVDGAPNAMIAVRTATPTDNQCPLWAIERALTPQERADGSRDARCATTGTSWTKGLTYGGLDVVVDDGTMVRTTGLPGSAAAADALADGAALVYDSSALWPDGTVHLTVNVDGTDVAELAVPGHVLRASFTQQGPVIPTAALPGLEAAGITNLQVGALAAPAGAVTETELAAARTAVARVAGAAPFTIDSAVPTMPAPHQMTVAGVAIALALALAATWIAVGLAAADQQPDLATLAAVGAEPAWRRRLAGAHAAVLTGVGTALGLVIGVILGAALTLGRRGAWPDLDPAWTVQIPWAVLTAIAIGLPTIGATVVMAVTRSRVIMVRRRAD